ncbi:MAG TPA: DUF6691 family protein [Burkholderiaceae bacterium]|nr:DUF6691 family protein [Burkholderiaceae bacterium]
MAGFLTPSRRRALAALVAGAVFGTGLAVAQMIDPRKVLGFLDVAGDWDASLLFVLGGAVVLAAVAFRVVLRRPAPLWDDCFHLSARQGIDAPLLLGAALFGIGWGLAGYCPGPAIASLAFGNSEAWWFVPAMAAGAALQRWQARARPPGVSETTARAA